MIEITEAKVQRAYMKKKVTNKKGQEKEAQIPVRIGTMISFNDPVTVVNDQGQSFTGTPTIIRHSFRHQTWSHQQPSQPKRYKSGKLVVSSVGVVEWEKPVRTSGYRFRDLSDHFGSKFIALMVKGHEMALAAEAEEQAERKAA